MKKLTITLFGISVFAGLGYMAFAYSPVGKYTLIKWLVKKWNALATSRKQKLNKEQLKKEFEKLRYSDLELMVTYTFLRAGLLNAKTKAVRAQKQKRIEKISGKIKEKKIWERAELTPFESAAFLDNSNQKKENQTP